MKILETGMKRHFTTFNADNNTLSRTADIYIHEICCKSVMYGINICNILIMP